MTSTLLGQTDTGAFLPRPKLTIMKMMNSNTLINDSGLDCNEQSKADALALESRNAEFDATGRAFVEDDYELRSDEEWATDSEEEEEEEEESKIEIVSAASTPRSGTRKESAKKKLSGSRSTSRQNSAKGGRASSPTIGSASGAPPKHTLSRNNSGRNSPVTAITTTSAAAVTPPTSPIRGGLSRGGSRGGGSPVKLAVKFSDTDTAEAENDTSTKSNTRTVAFDAVNTSIAASDTHDPNRTTTRMDMATEMEEEKKKSNDQPRVKEGPFVLPPDSPPTTPLNNNKYMNIVTEGNDVSWTLPGSPERKDAGGDDAGSVGSEGSEASLLTTKLRALTPQKDKSKISKVSGELDLVMIEIVQIAAEIENQVVKIKDALVRGILDYNAKLTYEERNLVFDELTALLGDDYPAREGFFDWRGQGVPGMRPRVIRFFCLIDHMAALRLELFELNTPEGRDPKDIIKPLDTPTTPWQYNDDLEEDCADTGRWAFVYNGVDVVTKVIHSLDFLRAQKEICSWYGRSFYFCANPMMLPFHIYKYYNELEMNDKIKEALTIKAHVRPLISIGKEGFHIVSTAPGSPTYDACGGDIASLGAPSAWKHEKYLAKWRILFDMQCVSRYPNWPNTPSVKDDQQCQDMWTALKVMFIRGKASIIKTYKWERKFINLLSTVRGKDLMIGSSGLKPDLMLDQQSERRLIEVREEAAIKRAKDEENAKKAAADREKSENSTLKFLSGLMAATAAPVKKQKTDAEIAAELALFERKLIMRRLTKQKQIVDLSDPKYDYPFPELFEGYSSVLDTRPVTASDLGFGRTASRSPSRPASAMSLLNPLKLKPISMRLYSPPPSPEPFIIVEKKKKKKKKKTNEEVDAADTGSDNSDTGSQTKKKDKDDKRHKSPKKKGVKTNVDKLLNDVVKPGEAITRQAIKQAASTSSKVSRVQAPSADAKKMTRRVQEEILPPVRRGGGAFVPEMRSPIVQRRRK